MAPRGNHGREDRRRNALRESQHDLDDQYRFRTEEEGRHHAGRAYNPYDRDDELEPSSDDESDAPGSHLREEDGRFRVPGKSGGRDV
jgi:hypothetical protein